MKLLNAYDDLIKDYKLVCTCILSDKFWLIIVVSSISGNFHIKNFNLKIRTLPHLCFLNTEFFVQNL
jgi:hypothetical protein